MCICLCVCACLCLCVCFCVSVCVPMTVSHYRLMCMWRCSGKTFRGDVVGGPGRRPVGAAGVDDLRGLWLSTVAKRQQGLPSSRWRSAHKHNSKCLSERLPERTCQHERKHKRTHEHIREHTRAHGQWGCCWPRSTQTQRLL